MNFPFIQINKNQLKELQNYLLKIPSKIDLRHIPKIYNEPLNQYHITVHCAQFQINSNYIKQRFNLHVAKWDNIITDKGLYKPNIDVYDKDIEYSTIRFLLID